MNVEQKALKISVFLVSLSSLWAIGLAVYSRSMLILLDASFSLLSAVLSFLGFFVVRYVSKDSTSDRHPLGFYPYEAWVNLLRSLLLTGMTLFLFVDALLMIFKGGREPNIELLMIYIVPSFILSLIAYFVISWAYKKSPSMTLRSDLNEWKLDTLITVFMFFALLLGLFLRTTPLAWINPYLEPGMVVLLCVFLIKQPFNLLAGSFKTLTLQSVSKQEMAPFQQALKNIISVSHHEFNVSSVEIVPIGRMTWIIVGLIPKDDNLPIRKFRELEEKIAALAEGFFEKSDIYLYFEDMA